MEKSNQNLRPAFIKSYLNPPTGESGSFKTPLPVLFHQWADEMVLWDGIGYNSTYGIVEDRNTGKVYKASPNNVIFDCN